MNMLINQPARNANWGVASDDLDDLFQGLFRPLRRNSEAQNMAPAMDIKERDNDYVIHAEMPGVNKEQIDITLADGVLTIGAETKYEHDDREGNRLLRQERCYGKFTRSVRLGTQIDEKAVKANYKDGVLELILPKAEEVKPKKISVG